MSRRICQLSPFSFTLALARQMGFPNLSQVFKGVRLPNQLTNLIMARKGRVTNAGCLGTVFPEEKVGISEVEEVPNE